MGQNFQGVNVSSTSRGVTSPFGNDVRRCEFGPRCELRATTAANTRLSIVPNNKTPWSSLPTPHSFSSQQPLMGSLLQSQALRYVSTTIDFGECHHTVVICKTHHVSFVVHQNLIGSAVCNDHWKTGSVKLLDKHVFHFFNF